MTGAGVLLEGVTVAYGQVVALNRVDLRIERGDQVAVVGESGSGKTTLLKVVSGTTVPNSGSVVVAKRETTELSERERSEFRAASVGFVYQDYNLIPYLTAEENVAAASLLRGAGDPRDALRSVGLEDRSGHLPNELSGGQQQRVSIARALIGRPEILLADEPTGALDRETGQQVMHTLLDAASERNMTVVCVTHDISVASRFRRVIRLAGGEIVADERTNP